MKGLIYLAIITALFLPLSISHSEESISLEENARTIICQPQYLWDCNTMVETARRESNYLPDSTNYDCYPNFLNPSTGRPYICAGLLQVMEIHVPDWTRLLDPYYNVEIAYKLWLNKGTQPWGY